MENQLAFFKKWDEITNTHLQQIKQFFKSVKPVCKAYQKSHDSYQPLGFNVFTLTSGLYYLENYHSDILRAFLDPNEGHGEGNLFLNSYLDLLGVDSSFYFDAQVIREEGRIDILIKSESSKHAVIIENKINNAYDTENQIPKYFSLLENMGYVVDKIVYLPLDNQKTPDRSSWKTDKVDEILNLLLIMPAVSKKANEISLARWIKECILQSSNVDNISILRQYLKLIEFLRGEIMDQVILDKFHLELKHGENLKSALSIRNMLNDLPAYLATKIYNKYQNSFSPFLKIWIYKGIDTVFECFSCSGYHFKCDIWCSVEKYEVYFWEQNSKENCNIQELFANVVCLQDFNIDNGKIYSLKKEFSLNEEEKLYEFIDSLLLELEKKV